MSKGIILKGVGGLYSVWSEDKNKIYGCSARGILRKDSKKPLIGDFVELEEFDDINNNATITDIISRRNELRRPAVANVDKLLFVAASSNPKPDLLLLDKMIISAEIKNIEFVLMISKSDQDSKYAEELIRQYSSAVECFTTTTNSPDTFAYVAEYIDGFTTVVAGQSGAGKSTFINHISGTNLMDTGTLSEKTLRGRHTTRHSELFKVEKGFNKPTFIIDSPGFSMLEAEQMEPRDLQKYYPEMYNNQDICRFIDCSHTGEPGCFLDNLISNGKMHIERYKRYVSIYKELEIKYKNRYK